MLLLLLSPLDAPAPTIATRGDSRSRSTAEPLCSCSYYRHSSTASGSVLLLSPLLLLLSPLGCCTVAIVGAHQARKSGAPTIATVRHPKWTASNGSFLFCKDFKSPKNGKIHSWPFNLHHLPCSILPSLPLSGRHWLRSAEDPGPSAACPQQ